MLDVWETNLKLTLFCSALQILQPLISQVYSADGKANGTAMAVQAISRFFSLGLDDWYPSGIPNPEKRLIEIDCKITPAYQAIEDAIYSTYDITADDKSLRRSVSSFEKLRGNYPLRREYQAYKIKLKNAGMDIREKLKLLGFEITNE